MQGESIMVRTSVRRNLLASTIIAGSLIASSSAFAQAAVPAEAVPEETTAEGDTIVVTGSLITNPNLERSSPVNVTTSEEIELTQSNVAEEILREIPGIVPSIGSAVNNGNGGASFVDLRGLGSFRNIVLLDGNRIAPSGLVGRVDLNNIPLALVERVDVLTGGASTTYGADAISGVVNFITKQDFAGVEVQASEQITEEGDGNIFRIDATIGANFDDGRGNATFSIGYQEADPVYQGARDVSVNNLDSFTGISGGGSGTSVPSRFSGTRPIDPATGQPSVNPATLNGGLRQINPTTGQAVPTFQFFNFNPFNIFQTPFERFNMYGQARYEINDAIEIYTRGLFSKNTVQTIIAPSGVFGATVSIPLSNPFLPAPLRNQFCAFDVNPDPLVYTPRFDPATCAAAATALTPANPAFRTVDVTLNRRSVEVGPRISDFSTTIFDYRLGARGAITDTINWDVSGAYGESQNTQTLQGYLLTSRVRAAVFASNPTTCLPNAPNGGAPISSGSGCVPLNIFGPAGSITPAQIPFITGESTTTVFTSLAQARATVSGDFGVSSPFAEEAIGFAIGGEFREYNASQRSDSLAQQPGELGGAGGAAPNITGGYDVYEAFGELVVPLVEDRPFFESLTFEAGVRYSHYSVFAAGDPGYNTTTYKFGGSWEPGAGVKVRGGYSHAVRAPNISELFTPVTTGLTTLNTDPCAGVAPVNNANLRAVCLAQGAPVGTIGSITNPTAGQANVQVGGNINLSPETSNSYTVGVVFQPEFVPGLAVSVDYYNIKVSGAITTPTTGDLITACFGGTPTAPPASAATDPDCTVIRRNPITGGLDGDPAITGGLFAVLSNLGTLKTDGIDVTASYRTDALGFADLALSFSGNYTHDSLFQATPTSINRNCTGFYSPNCSSQGPGSIQPKFQFTQRTSLTFEDDIQISLLWRYIDGVQYEPQQQADDIAAADAANRDVNGVILPVAQQGCPDFNGVDAGGCIVDPAFRRIKAAHYFDLTGRFGITDEVTLTLGVQNLFDKKPPLVGSLVGSVSYNSGNTYPSTYDALGRKFAASVKLRF